MNAIRSKSKLCTSVLSALLLFVMPVTACETWLKIMDDDPYSKGGTFHMFDVSSVFEDRSTGYVTARMIYVKPETLAAEPVKSWIVWAFDCNADAVFYVSTSANARSIGATIGWRGKPVSLKEPLMGGVTNVFGKKLCALKGSWPKGDLPSN